LTNTRQKAITGIIWSFTDNILNKGINFVIGIVLARLLEPAEFGLVAMITIFISISQAFVNSGLTTALIRKTDCTEVEYSTVFYYNITVAFFFYLLLIVVSPILGGFFNEPNLTQVLKLIGIVIVINALGAVQQAILIKKIDFRKQTIISAIASTIAGFAGIYLAFIGWSYWSLVWMTILRNLFFTLLLWILNKWKPKYLFSYSVFKELFNFGSKILLSSLLYTFYLNIYQIVIGKFFSAADLGFFNRAEQFKNFPSDNISGVLQRVSLPVLSSLQNEKKKLKEGYKKILKVSTFITFTIMMILAAIAEPLILGLIGSKWQSSIIYLQLLCFVGMLTPLHSLNLNILLVFGRSDLGLKLEILKVLAGIPVILIGIFFGIISMIIGMFVLSIFAFYLNSLWAGDFIGYSLKEQVTDMLPYLFYAFLIGGCLKFSGVFLTFNPMLNLVIQIIVGLVLVLSTAQFFKIEPYREIKNIIKSKISFKGV